MKRNVNLSYQPKQCESVFLVDVKFLKGAFLGQIILAFISSSEVLLVSTENLGCVVN